MEVAARTVLFALATENERNALPRRRDESRIGIYQEFLSVFRLPLQFDKLAGDSMRYVDRTDKTTVCSRGYHTGTAICSNIMRAGKHYVSFQVNDDAPKQNLGVTLGIMRPTTKDITTVKGCHPGSDDLSMFSLKNYEMLHCNNIDCCLMNTYFGTGYIRKRLERAGGR